MSRSSAEIVIYTGQFGIEFLLNKTYSQFLRAGATLDWPWDQAVVELESCLDGPARTAWNETAQAEIDAAEDGQPAEVGSQE